MPVLTEFLEERAQELAKEAPAREAQTDEWRSAVAVLFTQFGEWIAAADPRRLIRLRHGTIRRHERRLGVYEAPTLTLELDGNALTFAPVYRFVGSFVKLPDGKDHRELTGIVGVYTGGPSDPPSEGRRQDEICRVGTGADSVWGIRARNFDRDEPVLLPLTPERFERLVVNELR